MEMTPKVAALLMMLAIGLFLILLGVMGTVTADCPRPIVLFPEERMYCAGFTTATALGTLMALAGGISAPVVALYQNIRESRKAGPEA